MIVNEADYKPLPTYLPTKILLFYYFTRRTSQMNDTCTFAEHERVCNFPTEMDPADTRVLTV